MTDFANLKRNRNSISALIEAGKPKEKVNYKDERLWKPTVDKVGNGYAVIRFLPAPPGNELPWVRYWDHGFQGPTGQWYIEKSLTSIGEKDPVGEMNSRLWNTGNESDKELARGRKRRLHYVANVLVESDPANPSNEGKVFLYEFGKKIFDKIMDQMQPEFQDEEPVNPFDFWEGASFKLKIRNVEGYRNYDKSEFANPSALMKGDDTELEKVYGQLYDLREFIDPANYKSYDELAKRLSMVLAEPVTQVSVNPVPMKSEEMDDTDDIPFDEYTPDTNSEDKKDQDDPYSYFKKLADQ